MVGVALALRLTVMAFVYPERLNPARDYWRYGGEAARIARSIVEGKGFSNPYFADTGPTAWTPFFHPRGKLCCLAPSLAQRDSY